MRVTKEALAYQGSGMGVLPRGGKLVPLEAMLNGLLIVSGNDAADALAETNGSLAKTLADMNKEAKKLQAYDTVAKTPNGLDKPGQRSSAYDLALIARAGLPTVLDYFGRCRTLDRERAFTLTFGQSVTAFEAEVLKHLRALKD